jgi:hypothetical protein
MKLHWPIALAGMLAAATPGAWAKDKDKDRNEHAQPAVGRERGDHDDDDHGNGADNKMTICHKGHTITVGESAWSAHREHGDHRGACDTRTSAVHDPRNGRRIPGRFDDLDRNHDGAISRREWPHDAATFDRLDVNRDRVINRAEFSRI